MAKLRVTVDSLKDLGSVPIDGTLPGDKQTATIYCVPSLDRGVVVSDDDGMHSIPAETIRVDSWPWAHDLVDPTGTHPTGWGWTITVRPQSGPPAVAPLTPEAIAALPQDANGTRVARLEDFVGLSDVLGLGGMVTAGQAGVAAEQAAASAATAADSATLADGYADAALSAKELAETARAGAEAARDRAETARTGAESAATTASTKAGEAAQSAQDAQDAQSAIEQMLSTNLTPDGSGGLIIGTV